jgi:DnaJ-class molecular chaperone
MIGPHPPKRPCLPCDGLGYRWDRERGHTVACKSCDGEGSLVTPESELEGAGQISLLEDA